MSFNKKSFTFFILKFSYISLSTECAFDSIPANSLRTKTLVTLEIPGVIN